MGNSFDPTASRDLSALNSDEWRAVLPRLAAHAHKRLRAGCLERARDLAQDAVAQACERRLILGGEDPTYLLCGVINGLAMNERRRSWRAREVAISDAVLDSLQGGENPEQAFLAEEERAQVRASLRARFAKDAVALRILDLYGRRVCGATAQATASGLPIQKVRAARRRVSDFVGALAEENERA